MSTFKLTKKQKQKLVLTGILATLCIFRACFPEQFNSLFHLETKIEAKNIDFCYSKSLVKVTDGDTIKFLINPQERKYLKVRLIGIDAPEMGQKPFGNQSKKYLQKLIQNSPEKQVCCKKGSEAKDRYQRTLADCWIGEDFINAKLIEEGHAIAYFVGTKNNKYKKLFLELEKQAEEKEKGIHNPNNLLTESPYEWRRNKRNKTV